MSAKDIKPAKFDSNTNSKITFKSWSQDVLAYTKKLNKSYAELMKVAEKLDEWNDEAFQLNLGDVSINRDNYSDINEDLTAILRNLTDGDAKGMVDAASSAGEAWWRMTERFYSKSNQGATAVADKIQATKRPTQISDAHNKLTQLKALLKEFERQSPDEPLPSAVIKSALIRVLPESFHKTFASGITVDKVSKGSLEDRLVQIIRENSTGPAAMDISRLENGEQTAQKPEEQPKAEEDQWWPSAAAAEQEGTGAYALQQKGKGKGKDGGKGEFQGYCDGCNGWGHTWRYCPKGKNGKGKGKGQYGKGWSEKGKGRVKGGKGKGWSKGINNFENDWYGNDGSWGGSWSGVAELASLELACEENDSRDPPESHKQLEEAEKSWAMSLIAENTEPIAETIAREREAGEWQVPVKTVKTRGRQSERTPFFSAQTLLIVIKMQSCSVLN